MARHFSTSFHMKNGIENCLEEVQGGVKGRVVRDNDMRLAKNKRVVETEYENGVAVKHTYYPKNDHEKKYAHFEF